MRRIILLLIVIVLSYQVINKFNNDLNDTKTQYLNAINTANPVPQAVPVIPMFPVWEPPIHPEVKSILSEIDKTNINPEKLNWINLSDAEVMKINNYQFSFDFKFPDDYFYLNKLGSSDMNCAELLGKGAVEVITFCDITKEINLNYYLEGMSDASVSYLNNFKTYTSKYSDDQTSIFPRKQILIVDYDENQIFKKAALFFVPDEDSDEFKPKYPTEWEEFKQGYETDLKISQNIMNSFSFN